MTELDAKSLVKPVLELGNSVYQLAVKSGRDDLASDLGRQAELWKIPDVTIVIVGNAGAGKTALVDGILAEPVLAEGDPPPTRSHVTVRHAEQPEILVYRVGSETPERIAPVAGLRIPEQNVSSVEVCVPDPLLQTGLRLIDTPGLDHYEPALREVTRSALSLADAIVFATDASTPLSEPEVELIRTCTERVSGLVVALTRIDVSRDWRTTLEIDRALLEEAAVPTDHVSFLAVSARLAEKAREAAAAGDEVRAARLAERSGMDDVRTLLLATLEQREVMRLSNILRLCRSVLAHLDETERVLLADDGGLDDLEAKLAENAARAEEFTQATATWRQDLAHELQDLTYQANEEANRHIAALQTRYDSMIRDAGDRVGRLAETIPVDVDACLRVAWMEIAGLIARGLETISSGVAERFEVPGLEIVFDDLSLGQRVSEIAAQRGAPERHDLNRVDYLRAGWPAVGMGSFALRLAPLIGLTGAAALVATPLLATASLVAGGMIAKRTLDSSRGMRDRQEISRYVSAVLSQAKTDMNTNMGRQLAGIRQHMQQRIDGVLRERRRDLSTQLQTLKEMRSMTAASRKAERAAAQKRLARIERLGHTADELETSLAAALQRARTGATA